jgi:hypothetical protein
MVPMVLGEVVVVAAAPFVVPPVSSLEQAAIAAAPQRNPGSEARKRVEGSVMNY